MSNFDIENHLNSITEDELEVAFNKAKTFDKKSPLTYHYHFYETVCLPVKSDLISKDYLNKFLNLKRFKDFIGRNKEDYESARLCVEYIIETKFYVGRTKKKPYDDNLILTLKKKLGDLIETFVITDNELDKDEDEIIRIKGKEYGLTPKEIEDIVIEKEKELKFNRTNASKSKNEASSTTTKAGSPKLEIHNNTTFSKNGEFTFDNVKLTETRREVITIKNGGGGTLDATAIFSAKWIEVIPKKIHQSKLPQDLTIIIDPSKDKSLKSGSAVKEDTINLTYASSGATRQVPIVVKMEVEGHYELVKRQSKYATIVSSILAGLMLFYILSNYYFSGWAIFGFVVSTIAIGLGVFAAIENEKNMGGLIVGGIILIITNWTIFALLSTVLITFYTAKFIFSKNPFKNELIAAIPLVSFALFFILFFTGFNTLKNSNNNIRTKYRTTKTTSKPTYKSTISINKYAYIKADPIGNVRSGTSKNTKKLTSLNKGEKIYLLEQDKATNWYKIRYGNNNIGYVSDFIVSFDFIPKKTDTRLSNGTNNNNNNSTSTNKLTNTNFIGNWKIDDGNSNYVFLSNNTGSYTNNRGKKTTFRWSLNSSYLKIILDTDSSVWNWEINSFNETTINMYSSKNKLNRKITKI